MLPVYGMIAVSILTFEPTLWSPQMKTWIDYINIDVFSLLGAGEAPRKSVLQIYNQPYTGLLLA